MKLFFCKASLLFFMISDITLLSYALHALLDRCYFTSDIPVHLCVRQIADSKMLRQLTVHIEDFRDDLYVFLKAEQINLIIDPKPLLADITDRTCQYGRRQVPQHIYGNIGAAVPSPDIRVRSRAQLHGTNIIVFLKYGAQLLPALILKYIRQSICMSVHHIKIRGFQKLLAVKAKGRCCHRVPFTGFAKRVSRVLCVLVHIQILNAGVFVIGRGCMRECNANALIHTHLNTRVQIAVRRRSINQYEFFFCYDHAVQSGTILLWSQRTVYQRKRFCR